MVPIIIIIHYCANRLLAIKQLENNVFNKFIIKRLINRVKILQSVNDLLLQIDA